MPDRLAIRRVVRRLLRPVRRWLRPRPQRFELSQLHGPVLVAIAHPDDEAFCSGLICALRDSGIEIHLLCMTRGEGGERIDDGEADLASVREREMVEAAEALGVEAVSFLDHVDPSGDGKCLCAPEVEPKTLASQISNEIRACSAQNVVTHGSSGEYWHPAHLLLHDAVRASAREVDGVKVWTFNAWDEAHPLGDVLNRDDPAQLTVDAEPFHDRRLESLRRHVSQRAVFERFAGSDLETFVRKTAREGYHLANG